jgi:hypothetical protein
VEGHDEEDGVPGGDGAGEGDAFPELGGDGALAGSGDEPDTWEPPVDEDGLPVALDDEVEQDDLDADAEAWGELPLPEPEDELGGRREALDRWGGSTETGIRNRGAGFFRIANMPALERGGRSRRRWLIDPAGNPVWGVGVNTVFRTAGITLEEGGANTMLAHLSRYRTARPMDWLDHAATREWDRVGPGVDGELGFMFNNVGGFGHTNDVGGYTPPWPGVTNAVNPINRYAPYGVVLTTHVCGEVDDASAPAPCPNASFALAGASGRPIGQRRVRNQRGMRVGENLATMGDPYNPRFRDYLRTKWAPVVNEVVEVRADMSPVTRRDDPKLMYYWMGNEDGLFDHVVGAPPGVVDLRQYVWAACPDTETTGAARPPLADRWRSPRCAPEALEAYLRSRYDHDLGRLNRAWRREFGSWTSIRARDNRPTPGVRTGRRRCNEDCGADLQRFVRRLIRQWVEVTTGTIRELDPNHLVSSPRLAIASARSYCWFGLGARCREEFTIGPTLNGRVLRAGRRVSGSSLYSPWSLLTRRGAGGFDLISINAYSHNGRAGYESPWFASGIRKISSEAHMPVLVSEFGIRTDYADRTVRRLRWTNRAGALSFVREDGREPIEELQKRRGTYYGHDIRQFMSSRSIIGASLHRWADYYETGGRRRQMNMGIVDPRGAPYTEMFGTGDRARGIRATNEALYTILRRQTGGRF